ncbi:MAG: UDP-4-amino-4,6-dideoxy-N-acetyl-beta-L-altrosamine transaminase [Desulfuromonadaceae bacterium]|nr:UDP-4-amino-4,6-dideoxy-N-acetyl-beta-L-altrosamine transaminase [Desulfuromonadaceae bacterium]
MSAIPYSEMIPYGRQTISEQDIAAVVDVLKSIWLTQGPSVERFEQAVADYVGARFGVATNSATSALHIACRAAGLGPGDILWTSPNTFVASANCGLYCGASVDFVDIDPHTYNMCAEKLEEKLVSAEKDGKLPKIVIPVHFAGQSCDMGRISALGKKYGFIIIEDASHAIGGSYKDTKVGSCTYSDMTVFSFHPVKIITTGEGGMVVTNDEQLHEKLVLLHSHGITRAPHLLQGESDGPWYYQQIDLGYNYRMTDIQAALGLSQLQRIDEFVQRRHYLAERYDRLLKDLPLDLPWQHPESYSAFHLYVICLKLEKIKKTHLQVFEELREAGIIVNLHYIPVYAHPYYQKMGFAKGYCPATEGYYARAISIPLYFGLSDEKQDRVVKLLTEILL